MSGREGRGDGTLHNIACTSWEHSARLSLSLSLVLELLRLKTVQFSHNDGLLPSLRVQSGISTGWMMSKAAVMLSLVLLGNLGICVESD